MEPADFTTLLLDCSRGDASAKDRLVQSIYDELRRMAAASLRHERPGHTLQPTALVHELYLKLFAGQPVAFNDRKHFFAVAARQLRRILVDHARALQTDKRHGVRVPIDEADGGAPSREEDVLAVDAVLEELATLDPRAAEVIELRFFAGMTEREAADVMGLSVSQLKRDWEFARAWLLRRLS